MEIAEIKERLSIGQVLEHYNIQINKNKHCLCPFHADKTPSMRVYPKTNTVHCFSGNCEHTGKAIDQIDFIMHMEKCTKHEAITKAKALVGHSPKASSSQLLPQLFMLSLLSSTQNEKAAAYLKSRSLHPSKRMGFNNGRLHYKLTEHQKQQAVALGILKKYGKNYQVWAKESILFPLKNKAGEIVSLYARKCDDTNSNGKHFYLKNRKGLFPHYPSVATRHLILTESIIDAETLLQQKEITDNYQILALYGTNGFTPEHTEAIKNLPHLKEIILWFDGDAAGIAARKKYTAQLQSSPFGGKGAISIVETPEGEDINSVLQGHDSEILTHLLENRKQQQGSPTTKFNSDNPKKLLFQHKHLLLTLWGGIALYPLNRLKISLHVQDLQTSRSFRDELNLYSHSATQKAIRQIGETLELPTTEIQCVLDKLTSELESYREARLQEKKPTDKNQVMTPEEKQAAEAFLKAPDLVKRTLEQIKKGGLIGQDRNGLLLFFLYLSRLQKDPLHAIIFGKSGSGKTYLQTKIAECLPKESVLLLTSLTENTLYYSPKHYWKHKVLLIEDLEGVYQAFLPLREFMSKQEISKMTTDKDASGNNTQKVLVVEGPICVSGATTQSQIYEDNANRSFLLEVEETPEHQKQVMHYQRMAQAGRIDIHAQQQAQQLLQNAQRLLKPIKVVNPYAMDLYIPELVFKKLRTNMHYLKLIEIITFYHQRQRPQRINEASNTAYIETTLEDIQWANWLVRDSLLRKSDELSTEQRQFLERLKELIPEGQSFYAKKVRETFRMHPMKVNRYLRQLESMGYVKHKGGNRKTGYEYQITSYQEYDQLQNSMHIMEEILEKLKQKEVKSTQKSSVTASIT